VEELTRFKHLALSRLAAQHTEIVWLRKMAHGQPDNIRIFQPKDSEVTSPG
jgi:hypothetical protein